jgi:hypothetical protein
MEPSLAAALRDDGRRRLWHEFVSRFDTGARKTTRGPIRSDALDSV